STRLGHTNYDRFAPAAMTALKCLTHNLGVAYAFERIISTAVSQLNNVVNHIVDLFRVDEMRHAELACHGLALGVDINANDFVGTHHACTLNDVQAYAAQAKNHHI